MDYTQPDPDLAPSDPSWHKAYAEAFLRFSRELDDLQFHEAFKDAEDLGDYVETIGHLLSFRPHTRQDIERDAYEAVYGKEAADALRALDPDEG